MNALTVSKIDDVFLSVSGTAEQARALALETASVVERVDSPATQAMAVDALKVLADLSRSVEKSRKEVKDPVLNLGRNIDKMAAEFVDPISREEIRIKKLVGAYQQQELAKQRAAEAARQEEERRLLAEKHKLVADLQKAPVLDRQQAGAALQAVAQKIDTLPAVRPVEKPQGLQAKPVKVADIVDAAAAYAHRPDFFDLVPKMRVINDWLSAGGSGCPGITIREEMKVGVR